MEPKQDRDVTALPPIMRAPVVAWLAAVQKRVPHVEFRVAEALRTKERQAWLYAQGRREPYLDSPEVTWTMQSKHRWGLALDWFMVRPSGQVIWEVSSFKWIYKVVPPEPYGLRNIAPAEWMHVEHVFADEIIEGADRFGIVQH